MNRDDVIRMAREAGLRVGPSRDGPDDVWGVGENLERFAKLIRDDYSNKHAQLWLKRIDEAVKAERDACAKVCDEIICASEGERQNGAILVYNAIRSRGKE